MGVMAAATIHFVVFLVTVGAVSSYRHKYFSDPLAYKKFSIVAANKGKDNMMVVMKGKNGAPGEPGKQGDAGKLGAEGPPGPVGDKGPLGVCKKDQCELAELKALILRLEALEKLVKSSSQNKSGSPAPLKCTTNASVAQNTSKQGGAVIIVCISPPAPAAPTGSPTALKPTPPATKPPAAASPTPAPAPAPAAASSTPAPAPAPTAAPFAAPSAAPSAAPAAAPVAAPSLTAQTTVNSPVSWQTPPIPVQESTSAMVPHLQQTPPPQTVIAGTTYTLPIPAFHMQRYYKRHEIPSKKKKTSIHHHKTKKHKGKPASYHGKMKHKHTKHV